MQMPTQTRTLKNKNKQTRTIQKKNKQKQKKQQKKKDNVKKEIPTNFSRKKRVFKKKNKENANCSPQKTKKNIETNLYAW